MPRDEEELLTAAGRGEDAAFVELARGLRPRLEGFGLRLSGDPEAGRDLAQETLIRLWRAASQYRPDGRFLPYVYTIALNVHRSHQRRRTVTAADQDPGALPVRGAARPAADDTRLAAVRRALAGLPPPYREVLLLSVYGEMSYGEIAETLGCPRNTVASRKATALRLLRERAKELEGGHSVAPEGAPTRMKEPDRHDLR